MYWYNLVLLYMLFILQSSTHFHAFCLPLSPLFNYSFFFFFLRKLYSIIQHCYFYSLCHVPQSIFRCWILSVLCMLQCTPLQTNNLILYHFLFSLFYFSLFLNYFFIINPKIEFDIELKLVIIKFDAFTFSLSTYR